MDRGSCGRRERGRKGGESVQLIDVGVEDAVHEADAGAFVGVLVWELDVDFPESAGERCCGGVSLVHRGMGLERLGRTLCRTLESNVKFLPSSFSI